MWNSWLCYMRRLNFYAMQINLNLYAMWPFMLCDQFHFLKQTLRPNLTYSLFSNSNYFFLKFHFLRIYRTSTLSYIYTLFTCMIPHNLIYTPCNNKWRHIIKVGVISLPWRLTPFLFSSCNGLANVVGVIPLPRWSLPIFSLIDYIT